MKDFFCESAETHFLFPIDGDCINSRDGIAANGSLDFTAKVVSAPGCLLTVNGIPASEKDGVYTVLLHAKPGHNVLCAKNETDGTTATISIYFLPSAVNKYRISSDDNILFLADITANKDTYTSIFDNPYLAVYKKAHDLYGAKVHLNLFYEFDREAAKYFTAGRPDFNLSMMTDKFKPEWEANADWLKLSFHSRKEMPPCPYKHASAETITADYLAVRKEVLRFAGEATFASDVTTIHFGEANPACVAALRDLCHKVLTGYFEINSNGEPLVAYYAPIPLTRHVGERDFWRDTEMGMTFGRIDRVTNIGSFESVMKDMRNIIAHPHRGGFVSIMIHEQYFHPDYLGYLPDFEARVLEPAKLLFESGYEGSLIKEVICESLQ